MKNTKERGKYLLKNSVIFAIGSFGTKFINFFLVPIYTNVLSTAEYGTVDLFYTIGVVMAPILTINIGEGIMRFALDKDADYDKIMTIGFLSLFLSIGLGLIVLPVLLLLPDINKYAYLLYFYTVTLAGSQIFLCYLRGRELLLQYSIANILHTFCIAITNIILLVIFRAGIIGYMMAYIISNIFTMLYAFFAGKIYLSFKKLSFDKSLFNKMAKYSVVLIPNSFMWWIMNSSDRIMVSSMVGIAANGIYAVSYKIPTLLSTFATVFNNAWSYSAIKEKDSSDSVIYNNNVYSRLVAILTILGSGLILVMKPFLHIYVGMEYYGAWIYTPFLIIGFVFMSLGTFVATSYTVNKDSKGFLFSGLAGAIINVLLNLLFIPYFGAIGAAIATCFSYFTVFVYRLFDTRKYLVLNCLKKDHIFGYLLLCVSSIMIYIDNFFGYLGMFFSLLMTAYLYKEVIFEFLSICLSKRLMRGK